MYLYIILLHFYIRHGVQCVNASDFITLEHLYLCAAESPCGNKE